MSARRAALFLFLFAGAFASAEDGATPEGRVAELRADWADEHASLGKWAAGRRLGIPARAHFLTAIRLDPDCGGARLKLGHRRGEDGQWDESKEKEIRDEVSAREKHGEELAKREAKLLGGEAAAFAALGRSLQDEGRADLALELLLHAHFLDPGLDAAARGLGLVPLEKGFAPEKIAKEVVETSRIAEATGSRFLGAILGTGSEVRTCGLVTAEVLVDAGSAARIAICGQRALVLTYRRFSEAEIPEDFAWFALADTREQYEAFLDQMNLEPGWRAYWKTLGCARIYSPRYCIATWRGVGDPVAIGAPMFVHMMPENVVWGMGGPDVPTWFSEAAGIDAELTVLGTAEVVCVIVEQSQGVVSKKVIDATSRWPALLCRRAATGDLPKLEVLRTVQIQALSAEDAVAAHAYYRLLCLTRPVGMGKYMDLLYEKKDDPEAFREAFGATHEEITAELLRTLLGG